MNATVDTESGGAVRRDVEGSRFEIRLAGWERGPCASMEAAVMPGNGQPPFIHPQSFRFCKDNN